MKPFYTKVTTQFDNSVTIRRIERTHFYPRWHFHDEYEIVFIHTSSGIRYVGDSINPYKSGDLVLLGSRLPHIWINEVGKENPPQHKASATIIHFQRKFVDNTFFELPLMDKVKKLFEQSMRGIYFKGVSGIEKLLREIQESSSTERVIAVLNLLARLSSHSDYEYLSSEEYQQVVSDQRNDRLSKIHNYIASHFKEKISLDTLANIANMTPQAFCTHFKNKTGKSVFTYINDLKIGYSCKLLMEGKLSMKQIAFASGYNTPTFFNRKFKEKMKMTPMEYKKKFNF